MNIDEKTRDRIAKLPEWAQGLISRLEREATDSQAAADLRASQDEEARITTRMETGNETANVRVAADDAEIRFKLNPERYQHVSCQLRFDERTKTPYLQVLGSRGLVARMGSSNVLYLQVED